VSVECNGKTGFTWFWIFLGGGLNRALRGEDGSRKRKNCNSEGLEEGGWVYTDEEPGAKMEIPV
jgi:hypothetical protein